MGVELLCPGALLVQNSESMRILSLIPGSLPTEPLGREESSRRQVLRRDWTGLARVVELRDLPEGPLSIESRAEEGRSLPPRQHKEFLG